MKHLFRQLWKFKWAFIFSLFFAVLTKLLELISPLIIKYAIDTIVGKQAFTGPKFIDDILASSLSRTLITMVIMALMIALFMYISRLFRVIFADGITKNLKDEYYSKVQSLSFEVLSKRAAGDLIQRAVSDIETVRGFLSNNLVNLIETVFMLAMATCMMMSLNFKLSLITGTISLIILSSSAILYKRIKKVLIPLEETDQKLITAAEEAISGVRVVRAFGKEDAELEKFDIYNKGLSDKIKEITATEALYWANSDFLAYAQDITVIFLGIFMVISGEILLGDMLAFYTYVGMIRNPQANIARMMSQFTRLKVSASRVSEILDTPSEDMSGENLKPDLNGDIEFKNVSFKYPDGSDYVVRNLNFVIKAGGSLGILGETGSGKSSISYLLQRLYEYEGDIFVGGVELRRIDKNYLRKKIGLMLQEPFLFSRSIKENIAITGNDYTDAEIERASDISSIHGHILGFKDGYSTIVGEKGVSLSGGEKQRISMARILVDKNRSILIMDDSFSALDTKTDEDIRTKLAELDGAKTMIIISHRLSSISHCDEILYFKNGSITERGTHESLMDAKSDYYNLWQKQNKKPNESN